MTPTKGRSAVFKPSFCCKASLEALFPSTTFSEVYGTWINVIRELVITKSIEKNITYIYETAGKVKRGSVVVLLIRCTNY